MAKLHPNPGLSDLKSPSLSLSNKLLLVLGARKGRGVSGPEEIP